MDDKIADESENTQLTGQAVKDRVDFTADENVLEKVPRKVAQEFYESPTIDSISNLGSQTLADTTLDDPPRPGLKLLTEGTDVESYSSPLDYGKRKLDEYKCHTTKTNGVTAVIAVGETINSIDGVPSKRNLRRLSNSKESVLQNAIARKEKSFGLPDVSCYKKSKSPKNICDKTTRPGRVQSPKTNSVTPEKKTCDLEVSDYEKNSSPCSDRLDVSNVSNVSGETSEILNKNEDPNNHQEIKFNGSYSNENCSIAFSDASFGRIFRSGRRKKRHFKGLSYSFGSRKNARKKKFDRNQSTFSIYDGSEQDTDSQSIVIASREKNELSDLKSNDLSAKSSHSSSVLIEETTGVQNTKPTSLDVISTKFNEEAPSPSTGDTPKKAAKPESTLISSGEGKVSLCLCQVQEKVFMKSDPGAKYHCQATDSVEGKQIGCCNVVDILEDDVKLQRPSVKVTYQMFCKVHSHRLLIHNCCPICGLFCTQGNFVVCDSQHMYHRKCELLVNNKRICPHCGQPSPSIDAYVSIAQDKNPLFLPLQKSQKDVPSAKMSFGGSATNSQEDNIAVTPPPVILPAKSFVLPSGKLITYEGLPSSLEKEKLEKYLFGLLTCSSSSPAQRCTYRTLYQAARGGDVEKLMACLASGLNPNHLFRDFVMGSALHAACAGGFLTLVHILCQAGAQLDQLDKEHNTPLMLAAQNGFNDIVKYLVKAGANVIFKGKDGMTALHLAAKAGNLEACYYLLTGPRSPRQFVNDIDDGGWTSLVWAAEFSHLDVVRYLLSRGADPLVRDVEQNIALHWAAISGSVDICEALLHFNSDINCTNVHGDTPLHISARQDHYACVLLLLAQGARTDIRNSAGLLAIDCCISEPCDSYNAIKLNIDLKQLTAKSREKTAKILTNDITKGHELNPIQCVNAVDNEKEPTDFIYVTENCFTSQIKIDNTITSLKSCKCGDSCNTISCTCGKLSLSCWYTEDGILSPDFNYIDPPMIFECNSVCSCNKLTCKNRVVQLGLTCRFQLFRTKSKGWGVITLRLIPKGTYVCEYIGEIISDIEADTREDDSYLFDLDNKDGETYCIDAFRYGNIARFINHSCIPNLLPVKVFISHHDLHFPRIAFFSNRDIQPFEELGFDYGEKFWIIKYKSFTCTCGAEHCRYSEATIRKTLDVYNKRLQMEDAMP